MSDVLFGKHINRYYIRYAPVLIFGLLSLILVDYFQLLVPELYKTVINGINEGVIVENGVAMAFDMEYLLDKVCLPMIAVVVVMVIGRFTWRICFFGSALRVETDLRMRMFDHCKDLSVQYYQVNKVGNLMSLFTNDLETVQDCFGSGIMMFFDALLLGTLALIKMARMHLLLTVFSLLPMAILFVMGSAVGRTMMKKWEVRQEAFSNLSDFSQESFSGISVIKAFVKETAELMAFKKLNRDNEKANVDYTRISTLLNILVTLFVESVVCVILGYGGYLVHEGVFNAGEIVEFIGYFTAIVWPIMAVAQLIEMKSRGKASLNRISELLDAKTDVVDRPDVRRDVESVKGDIEFRDLTFRYPGGDFDVLEHISFSIQAGESVGIIGKTGAGKTTLVDLLLRTYNIPDGTVFLDGMDICTLPIRTVRSFAAYVPQDNFLFSDTIAGNIALASDSSSREKIARSAELAAVGENINEFKNGYDTVLGERGMTVSGGQKQRISIARALMKDAPILILDDSVSAVDVKTEKVILDNIKTTRAGKTTILIAHRISTVQSMDKIVLLDDGKLIDVGNHEQLMERCAAYRSMVELQRLTDAEKEER
ncbi:MAG: ABC transporter ATP-binding protein [Eubacteriales bacterium]